MVVQDHTEKIMFAVSDIGHTDVYIGHKWLKHYNLEVDWRKSRLYMNRCPPSCQFIDMHEIDEEDEETLVDKEEIHEESLEEGDHLFFFNADSFLEDEGITIARCHQTQENNRTNYDYVLKYNPTLSQSKNWKDVVPEPYHDYEDIFTKKDFDKLPERRPWDHAIELTPGFRPVNCKNYALLPEQQKQLHTFIEENLRTG